MPELCAIRYVERYMSITVHLLLHLPDAVEEDKVALAASGYEGDDYKVFPSIFFYLKVIGSCKWNKKHYQKNNSVTGYSLDPETIEYRIVLKKFFINKDSSSE